jgi:hypothetical protein
MEFLKKHYEKVLLSVVLVGLAVAAALLPIKVAAVRQTLELATRRYASPNVKPLKPLDLTTNEALLKRLVTGYPLALTSAGHYVFNPIEWVQKRGADKILIPLEETGVKSLTITNIVPLHTTIEYQGVREGGVNPRYNFLIKREASTNSSYWHPYQRFASVGDKEDVFTLKDVKGSKDDPTELALELADSKAMVSVARDRPYDEVSGYAADLRYEVENKLFPRQHQGQKITFGGVTYNIVAIGQSDVTLEDSQTRKRTTIHWAAGPQPAK